VSKGRIVSHAGEGRYYVEMVRRYGRINARLEVLDLIIPETEAKIADLESADEPEVNQIAFLKLKLANLKNEKADLQKYVAEQPEIVSAWCADYTLDLSGEVGLSDVPGEMSLIQIRPGYSGKANYNPARDGILQHAKASTVANTWLQACFMPAVRKWKPQYRYGTITAINYDNDTCSVSMDAASSRYLLSSYNVNILSELHNVPIEYMFCNSKPFELGDKVLIEYPDRKNPKVVGFKNNPKICGNAKFALIEINANGVYYYDYNLNEWVTSGEPVYKCIVWDIEANNYATDIPLNDGLGFAVFPCDTALISDFIENGNIRVTGDPFISSAH